MEPIYIADYTYPLTDDRIAKYPLKERDHSKLLVYRNGQISEDLFYNIGDHIRPGSLLIYNNTRVIHARLEFHKRPTPNPSLKGRESAMPSEGARIEIFLLEPVWPANYETVFERTERCEWKCLIGNAKKWKEGEVLELKITNYELTLRAYKGEAVGNAYEVEFEWDGKDVTFAEVLEAVGELPIPPYLNRKTEESDKTTYQTVYSRIKGSVAAPTAGLHFTERVLDDLRQRGIEMDEVTLHVGAGTFLPVKTADANEHVMHKETIAVTYETIEHILAHLGRIVAVGTTSMRTLESLYYIGCKLKRFSWSGFPFEDVSVEDYSFDPKYNKELRVGQFDPYEGQWGELSAKEALQSILNWMRVAKEPVLHAETQIMIKPGYEFKIVNQLITNFHQPQSTLLLLVSAFVGDDWKAIYEYALSHDFRFLSYGDSSILTRRNTVSAQDLLWRSAKE
ncbi:MAG: S-adenosylmethionine:tRNA ribosyltransferase-isomerase [Paludibacteraceae bacterium]|nr:S-adenosylmethionine:tRNA ribosyltransferase-isomerase [Paludibacteraceae bacterium]